MRRQKLLCWVWRIVSSGTVAAWMIFIFHASPLSPEEVDQSLPAFFWLGRLRNLLGHLVLYGVLACLLQISRGSWQNNAERQWRWAVVAAALATLYGVSDEYHQSLVPGRVASLTDIAIDGLGALAGAISVKFLAERALNRVRPD